MGVISTIVLQCFPGQIISIFGSNSLNPNNYMEFGVLTIRIYLSLILFTLIQKVTAIFLQASGHPVKATILSLLRDVIAIVPAMILLPKAFGIMGVLYSSIVSDGISIIVTIILLVIEIKHLNCSQMEQLSNQDQLSLVV